MDAGTVKKRRKKRKTKKVPAFILRPGFRFTTRVFMRSDEANCDLEIVVDRAKLISHKTVNAVILRSLIKGTNFSSYYDWRVMTDDEITEYQRRAGQCPDPERDEGGEEHG
ncbi:MAG: hypothetical protein JWN75_1222 [Candidatus Saccharibacteria bacterium]|nr:hypothetical protein [Candidatus Saccharibacteria bacterium]MDB5716419.1 hypothetical protein [Sphingomonadales bacterium]